MSNPAFSTALSTDVQSSLRKAWSLVILTCLFFGAANFPLAIDAVRFSIMIGAAAIGSAIYVADFMRNPRPSIDLFPGYLAFLILGCLFLHCWHHPTMTEYATTKRIYFYFIFPLAFFVLSGTMFSAKALPMFGKAISVMAFLWV